MQEILAGEFHPALKQVGTRSISADDHILYSVPSFLNTPHNPTQAVLDLRAREANRYLDSLIPSKPTAKDMATPPAADADAAVTASSNHEASVTASSNHEASVTRAVSVDNVAEAAYALVLAQVSE